MRSRPARTPPALLQALRPAEWGSIHVEPFTAYAPRAHILLPAFPAEVLEQWVYHHYDDAQRTYGWLDWRQWRFEEQCWPTERILTQVQPAEERLIHSWAYQLTHDRGFQRSWLGARLIEDGTWPVAPIVLDNHLGLCPPRGKPLHRYHLVEGHHRLAYLHALHEHETWSPQAEHRIWLATFTATESP